MSESGDLTVELAEGEPLAPELATLVPPIAETVARHTGLRGCVALRICDEQAMRELNRAFRNIDQPTEVLAFPAGEPMPGAAETGPGDVAISCPGMCAQARASGHSVQREFAYLLTHALLHLHGMSHQTMADTAAMRATEEHVLGELGLSRAGPA